MIKQRHRQEIRYEDRMNKFLSIYSKPLGFPVAGASGYSELELMEETAFWQYLKIVTLVDVGALPLYGGFLYGIQNHSDCNESQAEKV